MAEKNLALLIDAENISPDYMSIIRDEANKYGNLTYKRIYGDWAMNHEFGNRRTMIKALLLQTIAALVIATLIFQVGTFVEGLL
jgi:hypothetical protein